ncbi:MULTISPECIES: hypothetical protein [Carboxylicivirga]|nr:MULTISPECIES: hypothetical protein [Carboxylicivirga]
MKYLHEIVWYLSLPLTIVISYYAVLFGLKKFNQLHEKEEETE